jgi:hypothetical protein
MTREKESGTWAEDGGAQNRLLAAATGKHREGCEGMDDDRGDCGIHRVVVADDDVSRVGIDVGGGALTIRVGIAHGATKPVGLEQEEREGGDDNGRNHLLASGHGPTTR